MIRVREAYLDEIPPTSNHLYSVLHGRKVLAAEGRRFANRMVVTLGVAWQSSPPLDPNAAYGVYSCAHLHTLENLGYKTGKTQTRWKKRDASNLYKIVADTVSKLIGIDDSASFDTIACKRIVAEDQEEFMHIVVYQMSDDELTEGPTWLP